MLRATVPMDPARALWVDTGISPRYRRMTLDDLDNNRIEATYNSDTHQLLPHPVAVARAYVQGFTAQQAVDREGIPRHPHMWGKGLLFFGFPGTGKTTLATVVAAEIRRLGHTVRFVQFADYIERVKSLFNAESADESFSRSANLVQRVEDSDLVVLDDLGKEHLTDSRFAQDTAERLIRYRYDHGRATVVTTNLTPPQIKATYSAGLASFLADACAYMPFGGKDLRLKETPDE